MASTHVDPSAYRREFLWELSIAETQLLSLAESVPEESYSWRPAEDARSFSEVMVHIAAGNLMLMARAGVITPEVEELCCGIRSNQRWIGVVRRMQALQLTLTGKREVIELLKRSFAAVRSTFSETTEDWLSTPREFFGKPTTVRRVYLRILTHSHEHMGQLISYARIMGYRVPWPDPLKALDSVGSSA